MNPRPKIDKVDLPQYLAITLQGIYPKGSTSYSRDTYSSMFLVTLFTVDRNWIQP